jgi:Cytochrome oxidase complex assembly protein 1
MSNVPAASQSAPHSNRSWIGRHKFLAFLIVLLVVVLVGGYVLAWPLMKLRFHSQYQAAVDAIRHSPKVAERIGQPIDPVRLFPGGGVHTEGDRGEAFFYFDVAGPKGTAKVSAKSRLLQGQWSFSQLDLEFPDKQHLDIAQETNSGSDDTPKFDPNAKQSDAKEPDMPVDIALPDLPPEPKK